MSDYLDAVELVEPIDVSRVVPGDVDDNQVITAAVAAQIDLIATGDRKHLAATNDAAEALAR